MIIKCLDVAFFMLILLQFLGFFSLYFLSHFEKLEPFLKIVFAVSPLSPLFWDAKYEYLYAKALDIVPRVTRCIHVCIHHYSLCYCNVFMILDIFSSIVSNLPIQRIFTSDICQLSKSHLCVFYIVPLPSL